MKGDRELCTAAVAQDILALNFICDRLKDDSTILLTGCVGIGVDLKKLTSDELSDSELLVRALLSQVSWIINLTPYY